MLIKCLISFLSLFAITGARPHNNNHSSLKNNIQNVFHQQTKNINSNKYDAIAFRIINEDNTDSKFSRLFKNQDSDNFEKNILFFLNEQINDNCSKDEKEKEKDKLLNCLIAQVNIYLTTAYKIYHENIERLKKEFEFSEDKSKNEIKDLNFNLNKLKKDNEQFLENIKSYEKQISSLNDLKETQNNDLKKLNLELKEIQNELKKKNSYLESFEKQFTEKTNQFDDLNQKYEENKKSSLQLKQEKKVLVKKSDDLEKEIIETRFLLERTTKEKDLYLRETKNLKELNRNNEKQLISYQEELHTLKEKNNLILRNIDVLTKKNRELEQIKSDLEEEIEKIRKKLNSDPNLNEEDYQDSDKDLVPLHTELIKLKSADELVKEINSLKETNSLLEKKISLYEKKTKEEDDNKFDLKKYFLEEKWTYETEIKLIKMKLETLKSINELLEDCENTNDEINLKLQRTKKDYNNKFNNYYKENMELKAVNLQLNQKFDDYVDEIKFLKNQIKQLEENKKEEIISPDNPQIPLSSTKNDIEEDLTVSEWMQIVFELPGSDSYKKLNKKDALQYKIDLLNSWLKTGTFNQKEAAKALKETIEVYKKRDDL